MIRSLFFGGLFVFLANTCFSQTPEVRYFETSTFQTQRSKYSSFKRTYEQKEDYLIVKSYFKDALLDSGSYSGFTSIENLHNFFRFHASAQSYVKDRTEFSQREARVTQFYKNGTPRKEGHYVEDSTAVLQIWNKEGSPVLEAGSGTLEIDTDDNSKTIAHYLKYQLVETYKIRLLKGDTLYLHPEVPALPKGGVRNFHRMISGKLTYPRKALEEGAESMLQLKFIVDKDGRLVEFHFTNKQNERYTFQKKVLRELSKLEAWTPGYHKGRPVKTQYVLPITFRIQE